MDYLADWKQAQKQGHHPDCDGYMTIHRVEIVSTRYGNGSHSYQAVCEDCGKLHVGSFGQESDCRRHVSGHSQEVACDHRCLKWDAYLSN